MRIMIKIAPMKNLYFNIEWYYIEEELFYVSIYGPTTLLQIGSNVIFVL